jgi:exonuclease III
VVSRRLFILSTARTGVQVWTVVRLVTWNVAGRVRAQPEQAAVLAGVGADVIALQEVTVRTEPLWRAALADAGFGAIESAVGELPRGGSRRRLAVLTAARAGLERLPSPADLPWPERVLRCRVDGRFELTNVHSPIAPAPEQAKIRTHEAVAAELARLSGPQVLCGDLNTPRREYADGRLLTFAHDTNGRLREERGERWDRAERALVRDLGWTDAYRVLHGYEERSASWTFKDDRGGWRLDHVLVSGLDVVASAYAHDWRRAGLSDHSALVVDLASQSS